MKYTDNISKVTSNHSSLDNFKHNVWEILKPGVPNVSQCKPRQNRTIHDINGTNNEWRMCEYLGSMRDTGEDIKWRKILAIVASNQLKIIYDNKKLTRKTKIKAFRAYFRAYFPLQLRNLENNTFSSRKNLGNIIQKRILKWFGKVIRANESTPGRGCLTTPTPHTSDLVTNQREPGWALSNQTFVI